MIDGRTAMSVDILILTNGTCDYQCSAAHHYEYREAAVVAKTYLVACSGI